jgi:hypothetical protein
MDPRSEGTGDWPARRSMEGGADVSVTGREVELPGCEGEVGETGERGELGRNASGRGSELEPERDFACKLGRRSGMAMSMCVYGSD